MKYKFIDLFAGIGGIRLALESAGGVCVFSSENDKYSQATYYENFGEDPSGDITEILSKDIPEHDILCAGFPCQPFSQAGVAKYNSLGWKHGFEHKTKGTRQTKLANTRANNKSFAVARLCFECWLCAAVVWVLRLFFLFVSASVFRCPCIVMCCALCVFACICLFDYMWPLKKNMWPLKKNRILSIPFFILVFLVMFILY